MIPGQCFASVLQALLFLALFPSKLYVRLARFLCHKSRDLTAHNSVSVMPHLSSAGLMARAHMWLPLAITSLVHPASHSEIPAYLWEGGSHRKSRTSSMAFSVSPFPKLPPSQFHEQGHYICFTTDEFNKHIFFGVSTWGYV